MSLTSHPFRTCATQSLTYARLPTSPYTDPVSFVGLASILEAVGTTAYLGGAKYLTDPNVLTAAGSILVTEARHSAWIMSSGQKEQPWNGAYQTPLDQNQVYTLASAFITSCPSSNPTLPFQAFPKLTATGTMSPGKTIQLAYTDSGSGARYLALFSGLNTVFAPINSNKKVKIPQGLQGTVYAVVVSNGTTVTDASTIAGVAILDMPFTSSASNP